MRAKSFIIAVALAAICLPLSTSCHRQVKYADWEGPIELYAKGEADYNSYRIPGLTITHKGTILAFAEGRKDTHKDHGDINLVLKRSEDGGRTWGDMIVVRDDGLNCCSSPTSVVLDSGRILLLSTWKTSAEPFHYFDIHWFIQYSDDDGLTWSEPRQIQDGIVEPEWIMACVGPGHAIQLQNGPHKGRVIASCYHKWEREGDKLWQGRSFFIYSDDRGETWQRGAFVQDGGNECMSVELSNGDIMLNMREFKRWLDDSNINYHRYVAVSADGGETVGPIAYDWNLPSAVCEGSIIRYKHGHEHDDWLLFMGPTATTREALQVKLSRDCGQSWEPIYDGVRTYEAYSDMVELPDGSVALLYEGGDVKANDALIFDILPAEAIK